MSSAGDYGRKKLRECEGLVDALVSLVRKAIEKANIDNKSVENCVCILRNLSYRAQGSVQQSRLSSQFALHCCNLRQLLDTQKSVHFITICISIFNFVVFKMGFKWEMTVLLI